MVPGVAFQLVMINAHLIPGSHYDWHLYPIFWTQVTSIPYSFENVAKQQYISDQPS